MKTEEAGSKIAHEEIGEMKRSQIEKNSYATLKALIEPEKRRDGVAGQYVRSPRVTV